MTAVSGWPATRRYDPSGSATAQRHGLVGLDGQRRPVDPTRHRVDVLEGRAAVETVRPHLEAMADVCGAPVTARATWTYASLEGVADDSVWAVTVRHSTGRPSAVAVFLDEQSDDRDVVTFAGSALGHRAVVLADSVAGAEALGQAVDAAVASRAVRPHLDLGPLPADDPFVAALAAGLGALIRHDAPIPVVRLDGRGDVRDHLSPGMRRTLRKAANRLARDGRRATIRVTRDLLEIEDALPDLSACYRERDHAHGRRSELDDSLGVRLWESRVRGLATTGQLELSVLRVDGHFAGYAVGVVDGATYRIVEGRFVTRWARYSPGRLLEAAVIQRALDDVSLTTLDWMTSTAPDQLIATSGADRVVRVQRVGQTGHVPR